MERYCRQFRARKAVAYALTARNRLGNSAISVVFNVFRSYLRLGSLSLLMADLRAQGIVTKVRTLKSGATVGGIAFTRGPLAHLLRNRFYIG